MLASDCMKHSLPCVVTTFQVVFAESCDYNNYLSHENIKTAFLRA